MNQLYFGNLLNEPVHSNELDFLREEQVAWFIISSD